MSANGNQNAYPSWYGEAPAPQSVQMSQSSPPWRAGGSNYLFTNAASNILSVGAPPPVPPPQQTNGPNSASFRPLFSTDLKRVLVDRMAHADSEVVSFHMEPCGPGRSRVTVTFET